MRTFLLLIVLALDTHPFGVGNTNPFGSETQPERPARVLMFGAVWCGPCNTAKAEFKRLTLHGWKVDTSNTSHIQLVDGDTNPALVAQYKIESYPTFIAIKDGKVVQRQVGYTGDTLVERTDKIVKLYNDLYK